MSAPVESFSYTFVQDGPCRGGSFRIPGKNAADYLEISTYNFGWRFRATPGDPTMQIVEFDVSQGFSVRSSTGNVNPWICVRDRNDGCDIGMRVVEAKDYGEIRVGNTEGDYPGYHFHHAMGLKVVVDDGSNYLAALIVEKDGRVCGAHASEDGRPGITGELPLANGMMAVVRNGLVVQLKPR